MYFNFDERLSDSPLVERIWRTDAESAGTFLSQSKSYSEIVVTRYQGKTSLTVRGPETHATTTEFSLIGAEFFGIVLKIGAFLPPLPPSNLRDMHDANLPPAGSHSFWLHGAAWQFPTYENADTFVDRLVRDDLLVRDPVVESVLAQRPLALSPRAVQYRFVQATGLTYKEIQQIERARQAANLLAQGVSILDAVYEAGYFDQPHLTRSLRRFLGQTPTQITQLYQAQ